MSLQSSESQLKEALAALGELKALTEGLKAHAEDKTASDRLQKIESAIEEFKTVGSSLTEKMLAFEGKIESLAKAKSKAGELEITIEHESEEDSKNEEGKGEMETEANTLGGINPTVIQKKKKKQILAKEDAQLVDEKIEKKSGMKAAEATEDVTNKGKGVDQEGMTEGEIEEEAKGKSKAEIPPQFLKNIKKKKEEADKGEMKAADAAESDMEYPDNWDEMDKEEQDAWMKENAKSSKAKTKAAEPMEEEVKKDKANCGPKGPMKASDEVVEATADSNEQPEIKAEEAKVEIKAEESVATTVAEEAPAVAPVAVEQAPVTKAEEVAAPVTNEVKIEAHAEVVSLDSSKDLLAKELKAKEEALAEVGKMKAEFESLMERIAKVEAAEKSAEARVAKAMSNLGVDPVASNADITDDKPLTPEDINKQYLALSQTDAKEARRFYLKHENEIRSAAFGKTRFFS